MIVYLDTNIVVYSIESDPVFGTRAQTALAVTRAAGDTFMLSDLTRMESLVGPLRSGNATLLQLFRDLFALPDVRVVPLSPAVCDRAAVIRATTRFKPMDSLHLAAAVEHGADVFLTNDTRLSSFSGVKVEVLP